MCACCVCRLVLAFCELKSVLLPCSLCHCFAMPSCFWQDEMRGFDLTGTWRSLKKCCSSKGRVVGQATSKSLGSNMLLNLSCMMADLGSSCPLSNWLAWIILDH